MKHSSARLPLAPALPPSYVDQVPHRQQRPEVGERHNSRAPVGSTAELEAVNNPDSRRTSHQQRGPADRGGRGEARFGPAAATRAGSGAVVVEHYTHSRSRSRFVLRATAPRHSAVTGGMPIERHPAPGWRTRPCPARATNSTTPERRARAGPSADSRRRGPRRRHRRGRPLGRRQSRAAAMREMPPAG